MSTRVTFLFALTTAPADKTAASPHSAGWSESWWQQGDITSANAKIPDLANKRAAFLPTQGAIIGFRIAKYTLAGNKLMPTGSSTGKFQFSGSQLYQNDLPQVALEMNGKTAGGPNTSRFTLRGIPDSQMVNGEWQPSAQFKGTLTLFKNQLITDQWGFLGRDLTLPSVKVLSINGANAQLDGAIGAVVGTDYIRFRRVIDDDGKPVQGSFRVTNATVGNLYTCAGLNKTVTKANGTARLDKVAVYQFATIDAARAVVKKVGRPFESYRGRQSKKKAS